MLRIIFVLLFYIVVDEIESALKMPADLFEKKYSFEKPRENEEIVFYCRSGKRSQQALTLARNLGYER